MCEQLGCTDFALAKATKDKYFKPTRSNYKGLNLAQKEGKLPNYSGQSAGEELAKAWATMQMMSPH